MKFNSKKVNKLLDEMEVIAERIKATSKDFHRKLKEKQNG